MVSFGLEKHRESKCYSLRPVKTGVLEFKNCPMKRVVLDLGPTNIGKHSLRSYPFGLIHQHLGWVIRRRWSSSAASPVFSSTGAQIPTEVERARRGDADGAGRSSWMPTHWDKCVDADTLGQMHRCRRFRDEREEAAELRLLASASSCGSARSQTGR
jgi:hypothetical protein